MGGVGAFVLGHCERRPWACIRSDADVGSGAGTAERRPAAAGRLAITLPLGLGAYCLGCEAARPAPVERAGEPGADRPLGVQPHRPGQRTRSAGAAIVARLHRTNEHHERAHSFALSSSLRTRQSSQPRSSVAIARCTGPGYLRVRRHREAGASRGSGWIRCTPIGLPWSWTRSITYPCSWSAETTAAGNAIPAACSSANATALSPASRNGALRPEPALGRRRPRAQLDLLEREGPHHARLDSTAHRGLDRGLRPQPAGLSRERAMVPAGHTPPGDV